MVHSHRSFIAAVATATTILAATSGAYAQEGESLRDAAQNPIADTRRPLRAISGHGGLMTPGEGSPRKRAVVFVASTLLRPRSVVWLPFPSPSSSPERP